MISKTRVSLLTMLIALGVAGSNSGCGGGSSLPLSVTILNPAQDVQVGGSTGITATVVNDSLNKGVTWTVSCSGGQCGSVSPTVSSIPDGPITGPQVGYTTAYTAPSTPPASNMNVTVTATSVSDPSKSAPSTITVPSVAVNITPITASVASGGKQQFTATVIGDSSNGGVAWSLTASFVRFPPKVIDCGTGACGTLSATSTGSTIPVTYTAPATSPFPCASCGKLTLVATSAKNALASTSASIMLVPISVTVSPNSANVAVNATQQFTATTNDGTNSGLTWILTQNGAACSPGCGTIAPASTASGVAATYTPPATAPALPSVTINATSVYDHTKSASANVTLTTATGGLACSAGSGSESLLKGQYAFLRPGFGPTPVTFAAGSFTADGTGKITGGEDDSPTWTDLSINPNGSSYAVGPDHRGCVVLTNADGTALSFLFALGSINSSNGIATKGHIIDFDATGSGMRGAGSIRLQDATSFTASQFKGNYAFGMAGGGAIAGTLNSDGISALTSNTIDADFAGTVTSNATSTPGGSFTCCSANGRGTLTLNSSMGLGTFAMYMINSGDMFLGEDIVDGEAIAIPPGTTFAQASLSSASVLRQTAQSSNGPAVDLAMASADGKGAITVNDNVNNAGTFTASSRALNYVVASNGRATLSGGSTPPVLYLYGPNQGFLVGTDADMTFGILEPQSAGPFSNASFSGAYVFGSENPSAGTVTMESGVVTADGNGNAAGTSDQSNSTGLPQNQSFNFTYSFPADGVGDVGSGTTAILISDKKLVFISNTSTNPTITVVEK